MTTIDSKEMHDVVVVGGGAAGVGVAVALQHAGIDNFVVLERHQIGASFARWPAETRFITPSFPTNSFGMIDLNSVAIGVSPGFSLEVEHPTGQEYARHLRAIADFFDIPVQEEINVTQVNREGSDFRIDTSTTSWYARHVIWAAGEFQYPHLNGFTGSELCRHTSTIASYAELEGDDFIIIGGYESGVDAAYHLSLYDKRVRLFDRRCPWQATSSDPSVALSPFTLERMREDWFAEFVELYPYTPINAVKRAGAGYELDAGGSIPLQTEVPPLWAGGFQGSHKLIEHMFEIREDGFPLLNEHDESTLEPGLFLCGPSIRHDNHIFCFIYK
ncbi:MAG: NAD(P)/FAD-dependent oxidoreductase, partial [Pseudomonadota bacterium]